jgi:hypothetical protein
VEKMLILVSNMFSHPVRLLKFVFKEISFMRRFSILFILFGLISIYTASLRAQVRGLGAGALILDDSHGHTVIYQAPIPGSLEWDQWATTTPPFKPLTLIPSLPPSNNAQGGFVYAGPSGGSVVPQLSYWIPPNHNSITADGNTGGASGAWDYAASGQLGLVNGTGTLNTIPIWKLGDTAIGDSHISDASGTVTSSEPVVIDAPPSAGTPGLTVNCSASGSGLNSSTHFIDFIDGAGSARGSIQGQDMNDLDNDPLYVLNLATQAVDLVREGVDVTEGSTAEAEADAETALAASEEAEGVADEAEATADEIEGVADEVEGAIEEADPFTIPLGVAEEILGGVEIAAGIAEDAAGVALEAASVVEEAKAEDDYAISAGNVAKAAAEATDIANWEAQATSEINSLGVAYTSSAGDYAEYLKRADLDEHLYPGDIVGMTDGIISKTTTGAQSVCAISMAPIVLGNVPAKGEESEYSKVAFLGQIPVKVRGIVHKGDFIAPSGQNDGVGMAISPGSITPKQFTAVLGRAWSASDGQGVNLIKVAVGLSAKDISEIASNEQAELDSLHAEVAAQKAEVASRNVRLNTLAQAMLQTDPQKRVALLREVVSGTQSRNEVERSAEMIASKSGISSNDAMRIAREKMMAAADSLSAAGVLSNNIRHLQSFDTLLHIMKTKIRQIATSAGSPQEISQEVKQYLLHPDLQTCTAVHDCAIESMQAMPLSQPKQN